MKLLLLLLLPVTLAQDIPLALTYGYPLLAFQQYLLPRLASGPNTLLHERALSTSSDRSVVTPNVDTIYTSAVIDLSQHDVTLQVPNIPDDLYALFSFYDPFGNNWANVGVGHPSVTNEWRIRQRPANGTYGVQHGNETIFNSPSAYVVFLVRWLVRSNLDTIHSLQDKMTITNTSTPSTTQFKPITSITDTDSPPANRVYHLLSQYAPAISPLNDTEAIRINQTLHRAGVYTTAPDLTAANKTATSSIRQSIISALQPQSNGWALIQANKTGNFGTDYNLRALIASTGYLMLTAPDAIYPLWLNGSAASPMTVAADEAIVYTFSGKPSLKKLGFWSLTIYDSDHFLIPNERNVYGLGDRSNLTYANGELVYGGKDDGNFQILVQPADVEPPANWTGNWLPAPAGGGSIYTTLRWYGAEEGLLNGSYDYPIVSKRAAIRRTAPVKNEASAPAYSLLAILAPITAMVFM